MKNRDRTNLLLGALAGVAIGYWLNSEQGRKARAKAAEVSMETYETVKSTTAEKLEAVKSSAGDYIAQGIDATKATLEKAKNASDNLTDTIQNSFEKGVRDAQSKVNTIEHELIEEKVIK